MYLSSLNNYQLGDKAVGWGKGVTYPLHKLYLLYNRLALEFFLLFNFTFLLSFFLLHAHY